MKLRDKIEGIIQERVESSLVKIIENKNSSKEKINKTFDKLNDKIGFVKKYPQYVQFTEEKIIELLRNDLSSVDSNIFSRLSMDSRQELEKKLYNEIIDGKLDVTKKILNSIPIKNSSLSLQQKEEVFGKIDMESSVDCLPLILNNKEMKQIITDYLLSDDNKENNDVTIDKSISNIILKNENLLSKDDWKAIMIDLSKVNLEKSQELLQTIAPEEKSEFIEIMKRQYVYNMFPDTLGKELSDISKDDLFDKYRNFRNEKFSKNQHVVAEISDSIKEFSDDREIVSQVLDLETTEKEEKLYLLKEYIKDRSNDTIPQIKSLEELERYPETIYNRQQQQIQEGCCRDVIVKNITGFSSAEFEDIKYFFLKGHDIDKVFKANNANPDTYKVVNELIDFVDTLDDKQLINFAQNISKRNYNELTSGRSTLTSVREDFYSKFSNIISEYGKEFNSECEYSLNEESDDIKKLQGKFTILVSQQSLNTDLNEQAKRNNEHICMSVLTEGNYNVYGLPNAVTYVFDEIPEDLMIFSSHTNIGSKFNFGEYNIPDKALMKKSNFRTAENTSLSAGENTYDQLHLNTESVYYMSGFDKEGNFIKIKPKAIALFENEYPSEELIKKAADMGIDIVRIPNMQQNLEYMLGKGMITPSLVKGIEGYQDEIVEILSDKEILTEEEKISLELLQQKSENKELIQKVNKLLDEKTLNKNREIDLTSGKTKKIINSIENPETLDENFVEERSCDLLDSAIKSTEETTRTDAINDQKNKIVQLQKERMQSKTNENVERE